MKLSLTFEAVWVRTDPDGSPCLVCGEPIYSPMYVLCVKIRADTVETFELGEKICEACYEKEDARERPP